MLHFKLIISEQNALCICWAVNLYSSPGWTGGEIEEMLIGTIYFVYMLITNKTNPFSLFRNFFTKRTKELKPAIQSAPGWKLFGKVPPRENLPKDSKIIQQVSKHHTTQGRKIVKIRYRYCISLLLYPHWCYMTTGCSENILLGLCLSNSSY